MAAAGESNPGAPGHAGVGRDQRALRLSAAGEGRASGPSRNLGAGFPTPFPQALAAELDDSLATTSRWRAPAR
jgi:hypothetical protein